MPTANQTTVELNLSATDVFSRFAETNFAFTPSTKRIEK